MKKHPVKSRFWVSLIPNGLGEVKPNHYLEVAKALWENKDQLPFALRILRNGVCDGCALGTTGLRDHTMKGIHLCTVRLNLLRLNTMPPLNIKLLEDAASLGALSSKELRRLGRLPYPMLRTKGEPGFQRISWEEAISLASLRLRKTDPKKIVFYVTSRGITNEVYYVVQKAARFLKTNNVDNSSRLCHAPSTTALKETVGVGASTCSYRDWIGTDLLVFFGSNAPNNQPVTTKYMYYAKQKGTKILVVNPLKELGLERYWVPSVFESALFGTRLADDFFYVHVGGDIAFINGVLKHLILNHWLDTSFVERYTVGFSEVRESLKSLSWEMLEKYSGSSREDMLRFAQQYARAKSAVFVWSMGISHHTFGVKNVKAIVNLALSRGMVGREKCGLMPIRGHSGVQGGSEVGCVPNGLPGDGALETERERLEKLWRFSVPSWPGLTAGQMIMAAHEEQLGVLYAIGGNFLETLPDPGYVQEALSNVPFRLHQDVVLTKQMLLPPREQVLLLPAASRYEQRGGGTATSTERRIYFTPEIRGRRVGEAKAEWEIVMLLAEAAYPDRKELIHFDDAQQIREEISRAVPFYKGVEDLREKGDSVQWGGPVLFADLQFPTPEGRACFTPLSPPEDSLREGLFTVSTRRGKQFNSMVQEDKDPLSGSRRDDVLMNRLDAERLGLADGEPVLLTSETGRFEGRCKIAEIRPGNLQVHWPEANSLLKLEVDPVCGMPEYNALVRVERITANEG